ncbi:pre-toxin TG domain-containing protein [Priestia megaterium]|uniref:pre-toxin TG domain-containing protein n=1 Tax=Priestia megaterium TaxID=1404 RepID=UPI00114543F1|nr:pre-toxin TG domain-containing protein [Priestia megaterium]
MLILKQNYKKPEIARSVYEEEAKKQQQDGLAAVSFVADMVPMVSNVKGGWEASVGYDPITGNELSSFDRSVSGAGIVFGGFARVPGKVVKYGSEGAEYVLRVNKAEKTVTKHKVKDVSKGESKAVTKTPHPDISGIYEVKYKLPVYDGLSTANGGKGNFTGQWKEYKNPKTIYDPKVFSDEQILKLGREAMEEGISNNRIIQGRDRSPSDMVEGYVNVNGKQLKFMGFKDKNTGEISNFFPVLD